jgi:hypothetical protein
MAKKGTQARLLGGKKTTPKTDAVRSELEKAGFSSKDMPTDYEREQARNKPPAKSKERTILTGDPNTADIGAMATAVVAAEKKRKAENERLKKLEEANRQKGGKK